MMRLILLLMLMLNVCYADPSESFHVKEMHFNCTPIDCPDSVKAAGQSLVKAYDHRFRFESLFQEFLKADFYESLAFDEQEERTSFHQTIMTLHLKVKMRPTVQQIFFHGPINSDMKEFLQEGLELKAQSYFSSTLLELDQKLIQQRLIDRGYPQVKVRSEVKASDNSDRRKEHRVQLHYHLDLGEPLVIDHFYVDCRTPDIEQLGKESFGLLVGRPYVSQRVQEKVQELKLQLEGMGYYTLSLNATFVARTDRSPSHLLLQCQDEQLYDLRIQDPLRLLSKERNYQEFREVIKKLRPGFLVKELTKFTQELLMARGHQAQVRVQWLEEKKSPTIVIMIDIQAQPRGRIEEVQFRGSSRFKTKELQQLFEQDQSDLTSAGYLDQLYYEQFKDRLIQQYVTLGHLMTQVTVTIKKKRTSGKGIDYWDVLFDINEGTQSMISAIHFEHQSTWDQTAQQLIDKLLTLKVGVPFNPLALERDLEQVRTALLAQGYFDIQLGDLSEQAVVRYERQAQEVQLSLGINPGRPYALGDIYLFGLQKTKPWLMQQVLSSQQGHPLLTPSLLQELQSALASTALFSSYELQVMPPPPNCRGSGTSEVCLRDLVMMVQERDYGSFELAPGFRNDLGLRLEAKFIYGNLFGLNQSFLLEGTFNQRISDINIAPARQSIDRLLEYNLKSGYNYPYFFKTSWDYAAQFSIARVSYFNFDADIDTLGHTFSRRYGERLDFSLQQQLENVEQYSGVAAIDNGRFRVGSLTPALTYDGRDNAVNTKKGHWWNFSLERASPELLSSNSDRYEIDYVKFTARSRLYLPISSQWTVACSLATGVQKNLQQDPMTEIRPGDPSDLKRGFIPPIKLFRLNGIDLVRGFAEEEINRLPNGEDISSVLIQDRVYMTVVKLEPRYQWSDQLQVGLFVDAGRLQRDHYDPTDLRSSAGLSIKYLTPVGTLDLDYGHKLLRKRYPNGSLDDPGRIHLSIGFF